MNWEDKEFKGIGSWPLRIETALFTKMISEEEGNGESRVLGWTCRAELWRALR